MTFILRLVRENMVVQAATITGVMNLERRSVSESFFSILNSVGYQGSTQI